MIQLRRILWPCDFSEFSDRALEHALPLARWYGAGITALHILSPPASVPNAIAFGPGPILPYEPVPAVPEPDLVSQARAGLLRLLEPARTAGVATDTVVEQGRPAHEIVSTARSVPADLVVIGTHGRGGFARWVLGYVTEKVLRQAPCPVLTVPAQSAARREGGLFKRILCATDFSEPASQAARYAFSLAQEAQARVALLHVLEGPSVEEVEEWAHVSMRDYYAEVERDARRRLHEAIPEEAPNWCEIEEVVSLGRAHREILSLARAQVVDLIVLGVHGRSAVELLFFGSTTHHVVREAHCAVLTVRT